MNITYPWYRPHPLGVLPVGSQLISDSGGAAPALAEPGGPGCYSSPSLLFALVCYLLQQFPTSSPCRPVDSLSRLDHSLARFQQRYLKSYCYYFHSTACGARGETDEPQREDGVPESETHDSSSSGRECAMTIEKRYNKILRRYREEALTSSVSSLGIPALASGSDPWRIAIPSSAAPLPKATAQTQQQRHTVHLEPTNFYHYVVSGRSQAGSGGGASWVETLVEFLGPVELLALSYTNKALFYVYINSASPGGGEASVWKRLYMNLKLDQKETFPTEENNTRIQREGVDFEKNWRVTVLKAFAHRYVKQQEAHETKQEHESKKKILSDLCSSSYPNTDSCVVRGQYYCDSIFHSWMCTIMPPTYGLSLHRYKRLSHTFNNKVQKSPASCRNFHTMYTKAQQSTLKMGGTTELSNDELTFLEVPKLDLTPDEFLEQFEEPNKPVILKNIANKWPLFQLLNNDFKNLYHKMDEIFEPQTEDMSQGHMMSTENASVASVPMFECEGFQMSIPQYVQYATTQEDERPVYLFDPYFQQYLKKSQKQRTTKRNRFDEIGQQSDNKEAGDNYDQEDQKRETEDRQTNEPCELWHNPPHFARDDLFKHLGEETRPFYQWLIAGPKRGGSSFHIDPNMTNAWNACLTGRKRWLLFPSSIVEEENTNSENGYQDDNGDSRFSATESALTSARPGGVPASSSTKTKSGKKIQPIPGVRASPDMLDVATPVSIAEWFLTSYKDTLQQFGGPISALSHQENPSSVSLRADSNHKNQKKIVGYECICEAGEIIFVPHGWWHTVINLEDSVAITQNYVSRSNLKKVLLFLKYMPKAISGLDDERKKSLKKQQMRSKSDAQEETKCLSRALLSDGESPNKRREEQDGGLRRKQQFFDEFSAALVKGRPDLLYIVDEVRTIIATKDREKIKKHEKNKTHLRDDTKRQRYDEDRQDENHSVYSKQLGCIKSALVMDASAGDVGFRFEF